MRGLGGGVGLLWLRNNRAESMVPEGLLTVAANRAAGQTWGVSGGRMGHLKG
jgi:hypothetical protein